MKSSGRHCGNEESMPRLEARWGRMAWLGACGGRDQRVSRPLDFASTLAAACGPPPCIKEDDPSSEVWVVFLLLLVAFLALFH